MRRVLVYVWGSDAKSYVGRSMTLYCDPNVQFGGLKVGGIRISHMSHIDAPQTMALTATRARRAPFTVQPLEPPHELIARYAACQTTDDFEALEIERQKVWKALTAATKQAIKAASVDASARVVAAP